jgi:translation initiation factor 4G
MGYPPQWQGQQPVSPDSVLRLRIRTDALTQGYGGPPQYPYYAQQQGFPPNFVPQQMQQQQQQQQQGGPQSIPLPITSSGASTPSVGGVRTPSTVGPSSPAAPLSMGGPPSLTSNTSYNSYSSPQPQSAVLPHHPLSNAHSPYTPTSLRAPQSPFSLSGAANAAEFRPNVDAPTFVLPSPRKSAAIQIRNPKTMPKKEVVAEATPAVAEVKVESKDAAAAVVAEETAAAAAAKNAAAAKVIEEKKAADALAEKARVEKEAADAKDKADKEAKVAEEAAAAATAAAAVVAAAAAAAVAAEAAAAVKVVEEKKVEDSAAAAAKAAPAAPATPVLPSFLPAKPAVVESAPTAPTPAAAASTPTEGAHSTDISVESEPGKYRYDRDFLVQFMLACMEKADHLPNLEAIGMVDGGGDSGRSSSFAGSRRTPSQMGPPAVPVRGSSGAGFTRNASGGAFGGMGNFGVSSGASPLSTSQARFEASAGGGRSSSGQFPVRPGGSMSRQGSQSGIISAGANFVPSSSNQRVRSVRGQPREENKRGGGGGGGGGGGKNGHVTGQGFEDAPPLVHSAERWMPTVVSGPTATAADPDSPEMVVRKVKALLNKLTLEKFDSISDQILAWADKSVNETDGRILRQVIALIFEKATDEANWSEMYARLCRKLMEMVSVNVKDDTVKGPDGSSVAGGALFRKYLLNRCQEDYESGWKLKEVAAAAAAGKAADDHAKKEANDAAKKEEEEKEGAGAGPSSSSAPKEAELLSDEYYAAQKAKRRGLGLVRFIGELFQLTMLTERIMHECIKKLLANTTDPEEEDVESLCRLLTTIGKSLDVPKAKQHMDIYFGRMKTIADNMKISSRIRFMIQVRPSSSFLSSTRILTRCVPPGRPRAPISAMAAPSRLGWSQAHFRDPLRRTSPPLLISLLEIVLTTIHPTGSASDGGGQSTNCQLERQGNASSARPALPTQLSPRTRPRRSVRRRCTRCRWLERPRPATTGQGRRPQLVRQDS